MQNGQCMNTSVGAIYGAQAQVLSSAGDRTACRIRTEDGWGDVTHYDLFPGISLQFNEIHGNPIWEEPTHLSFLELNYCLSGRYECAFGQGVVARVREDDFAACPISRRKVEARFPLGYYRGISLAVDALEAQAYFDAHLSDFHLDIAGLNERLCPCACFVAHTDGALRALFRQLYDAPGANALTYYRIKVLELLALLGDWRPGCEQCAAYLRRDRAERMRRVAEQLRLDLRGARPIAEIARENGMGLTVLKRDFARSYGVSPGAYRKRCRMETAARMLLHPGTRIADVAAQVGYENPSKFAAAFRAEMGLSPAEHQKSRDLLGSHSRDGGLLE